ncbi:MAG: hypothetical protein Q4P20_13200, partial [Eubacteriales bacterium]|nr:hypothetical protein [Eubacteriales bacterium]
MKNARKLEVIGTASVDLTRFRAFRSTERQKAANKVLCWPSTLWNSYFYENQDLCKYAEVGYYDCNSLHSTPKDSFDKQVEETCRYLKIMGLEWELLFQNDIITIIKYGNFAFGLPTDQNIVEYHKYSNLDDVTLSELREKIGTGINDGVTALIPNGEIT